MATNCSYYTGYLDIDNELGELYSSQVEIEGIMSKEKIDLTKALLSENEKNIFEQHKQVMTRIAFLLDKGRRRKFRLGRAESCGFEHCCVNFAKGEEGNCICQMDDVLDCWVCTEENEFGY